MVFKKLGSRVPARAGENELRENERRRSEQHPGAVLIF
jgi:hypothetical protein